MYNLRVINADVARKSTEDETANKKIQDELEIASFMEAKWLNKLETTAPMEVNPVSTVPPTVLKEKTPEFTYVPTEEEIEFMNANDPVVKKKTIELVADKTLTEEQRSAQLTDFILMKNQQALQDVIGKVKKGQNKSIQPTKAQVIVEMKTYRCHVGSWKMSQFKRMSHDQIEGIYYRVKRQDSDFIPINFEEEERGFPKSKRKATASE